MLADLARAYEHSGNFAKAAESYETLLTVEPESAVSLQRLALIYLEQLNRLDRAFELASHARTLEPVDPIVADTLGWTLYRRGNYRDALSLIREAEERQPDNGEIQFHFALANYMMDNVEAASVAFERVVALAAASPTAEEARRWLAYLRDDDGAPKQLLQQELEDLIRQRPGDLIARVRLGELLEARGATKEAASFYEAALNANPNLTKANLRLARLYLGPLHDLDKALELAKKARELDPNDPQIARTLGKIAYLGGNMTWARDLLSESARLLPKDGSVAYDLAWAQYGSGKIAEARESMRHVIECKATLDETSDARRFLALTDPAAQRNDIVQIVVSGDKTLAISDYVPAMVLEAAKRREAGDLSGTVEIYQRVLERFPEFAPAQKALAAIYMQDVSKTSQAYELAVKARQTLSDDVELAQLLGELCYRQGEYRYAIQLFEERVRAKSLSGRTFFFLGMCQLQLGEYRKSRDALKRGLELGLAEPFVSDAHRALAQLKEIESKAR
jgi:tetratricopeptide (TPR) repeat protein